MREFRRKGGLLQSIAAFGFGAVVGSIAALLYAPASGRVTRRRLAMRAQALRREAARQVGKTQRVLAHKAEDVRDAAGKWIHSHLPRNGKQVIAR